jgi:hypothetical protein
MRRRKHTDRRRPDHIEQLCALVKEAAGTMRLYGKPVDAAQLREHCERSATERVIAAVDRATEERQWRAVWSTEAT